MTGSMIPFKSPSFAVSISFEYGNGNVLDYEKAFFEHCTTIEDVRHKVYYAMINDEPLYMGDQLVNLRHVLHVTIIPYEEESEESIEFTTEAFTTDINGVSNEQN